ncbi:heterokaryon incompatibility protein-domain-containing protein [Pestalotiopsis sp. NC0098]|nr:heterokaryon incompatibility protein-domain-containing protein [Pestalotiopsis sp. NC0098]
MTDTFLYKTLECRQFRLLRIKRKDARDSDRVREYELETTSPGSIPKYYAISYAWGDGLQRTPITINGMELMVPINTAKALESIRIALPKLKNQYDQLEDVRIWIDAICINQSDDKERAQQVSFMDEIYQDAAAVTIWLGDHASDEEAKAAFQSLHDIYDAYMHWSGGIGCALADASGFPRAYGRERWLKLLSSVSPVYTSSWFERVWTVQESTVARKVWCILGSSILPLHEITVAAAALTAPSYAETPENLKEVARGLELANARGEFKSLIQLRPGSGLFFPAIKAVMGYSASDPRDMVLGILGLGHQSCSYIDTPVDYTCTVQELFANVTVQCVIFSESLEPLQIAATQSEEGPNGGFSSWAMRLDRGKYTTLIPLRPQFPVKKPHSKSRYPDRTICEIPLKTKWTVLGLEGAILDEVTHALPLNCLPQLTDPRFIESIFSIYSAISTANVVESSQFSAGQSVIRVLEEGTMGFDDLRSSVARILAAGLHAKNEEHVEENLRYLERAQSCLKRFSSSGDVGNLSHVHRRVRKGIKLSFRDTKRFQRAFLITKEGRLGIGPITTLPGDQVCVFSSGSVPFVLRQQETSWRLMGDAYIDGLDKVRNVSRILFSY